MLVQLSRIIFFCTIVSDTWLVTGFPAGAPCGTKDTLLPNPDPHGPNKNDNSIAPFEILVFDDKLQETNCYTKGSKYTVKIKPKSSKTIKGFILQGQDASTHKTLGKFDASGKDYKFQCDGEADSITHKNAKDKPNVEAVWTLSEPFEGKLVFNSTIVEDLTTYWTHVPSKILTPCAKKSQ